MKRQIPNYVGITKLGLIPLRNFAMVDKEKNIYRSAQPMYAYEYAWLKNTLGIDTIVNLRSELKHDEVMNVNGFKVININIPDHCTPTLFEAKAFINLIQKEKNILFHCEHGQGRTSLFCVLARIAMGWTLKDALEEEVIVFGYNFKHPKQLQFLKQNFS